MDMPKAWGVLNEKEDLSLRMADVVELPARCTTAAKCFEGSKQDIVHTHLENFVNSECQFMTNFFVNEQARVAARQRCTEEALIFCFEK